MAPRNTEKSLRFSQMKALRHLAESGGVTKAAAQAGYTRSSLSRLAHSTAGQAELDRLREAAELELMQRLPVQIRLAFNTLNADLHDENPRVRRAAVALLFRTFGKELIESALLTSMMEGNTIGTNQTELPTTPKEGTNHEKPTRPQLT